MVDNPQPPNSVPSPSQPPGASPSSSDGKESPVRRGDSWWFRILLVLLGGVISIVVNRSTQPSDELAFDFQTTEAILIKGERFFPSTFQIENLGSRSASDLSIHIEFDGEIVGISFKHIGLKAEPAPSPNQSVFEVRQVPIVKGEILRFTIVSRGRPLEPTFQVRSENALGHRTAHLQSSVEDERQRVYAILILCVIVGLLVWLGVRQIKKENKQLMEQVLELGGKPPGEGGK